MYTNNHNTDNEYFTYVTFGKQKRKKKTLKQNQPDKETPSFSIDIFLKKFLEDISVGDGRWKDPNSCGLLDKLTPTENSNKKINKV